MQSFILFDCMLVMTLLSLCLGCLIQILISLISGNRGSIITYVGLLVILIAIIIRILSVPIMMAGTHVSELLCWIVWAIGVVLAIVGVVMNRANLKNLQNGAIHIWPQV